MVDINTYILIEEKLTNTNGNQQNHVNLLPFRLQ